ncbi:MULTISPECIES: hypothetical protein [Bradyrhizobium]|nr:MULTISPECIES: hypothetical protein [Bradyrhizobium]MDT4736652.1 hypothetical protein [Bradyrhizobium sp. WYCCWR 12699]
MIGMPVFVGMVMRMSASMMSVIMMVMMMVIMAVSSVRVDVGGIMVMRMGVSNAIRVDMEMIMQVLTGLPTAQARFMSGLEIDHRGTRLGAATAMSAHQAASPSISMLLIFNSSP